MVHNNGSPMALSQCKTTIAVLRGILGPYHGREDRFASLANRSRSWVKKVSAGLIPISEGTARRLELETGVALDWLMGPPDAPPLNGTRQPYKFEHFDWHRAKIKAGELPVRAGGFPLFYALKIASIGSAAGEQGKASLFMWRLDTFLDECTKEFGFDEKARAIVGSIFKDAAKKAPYLAKVAFADKGFDPDLLTDKRIVRAIKKAVKGKAPGERFKVKVTLPPEGGEKKRRKRG
jgi:hypothetical protein